MKSLIKKLYKERTLREKTLLLFFSIIIFLIWIQSISERTISWGEASSFKKNELLYQSKWLDKKDLYEAKLDEALQKVEPEKTFSATELSGKIDELIRKINLENKTDIDSVKTNEGLVFNDHNMRIRLNNIPISKFIEFNNLLKLSYPYIAIKSLRITKNQRNPEEINIRYEINSFDLNEKTI